MAVSLAAGTAHIGVVSLTATNLTRHNCQPYRVGLDNISTLRYVAPSEATAMALAHYPP